PDAGISVEVAGVVFRSVRVVPEGDRHRGHRRRQDELAQPSDDRTSVRIEALDLRPQATAGDLARPHRDEGTRADERRADVGAAPHPAEQEIAPDAPVNPLEAFGEETRPRRADATQARVTARAAGHEPRAAR